MEQLLRKIENELGLDLRGSRQDRLQAAILALPMATEQSPDLPTSVGLSAAGGLQPLLEQLVPHATVGETYFWREPETWALFESSLLPKILDQAEREGRSPRFWSAGCSTGEEAYSIAIACNRVAGRRDSSGRPRILGSDINADSIARARRASFRDWSMRGVPDWFFQYFSRSRDGHITIEPAIASAVQFQVANLNRLQQQAVRGAPFDAIFCRHVLMYFQPEAMRRTVAALRALLAENGLLIVGVAEAPLLEGIDGLERAHRTLPVFQLAAARLAPAPAFASSRQWEVPASPPMAAAFGSVADFSATEQQQASWMKQLEAMLREDSPEVAIAIVDERLIEEPELAELHYVRGLLLTLLHRKREALAAFRAALYLDPMHDGARQATASRRMPGGAS